MSLSGSMWTSVSGLLAHGNKMNVVGNNIANVSTIGFKGQRMDFNDYLYVNGSSTSGPTQVGQGVSTYAVLGDYSQGSFETTNSGTDLALDGKGFFQVRKPNSDQFYYTRAGDFYFNKDRELINPEGMMLQGWKVENKKSLSFATGAVSRGVTKSESPFIGSGTPTDIILDSWSLPAQRTTNMTIQRNLTKDAGFDKTSSATNPMDALFTLWNGSTVPPIPKESYATHSSMTMYDEGGTKHEATVFFDQVASPGKDGAGNTTYTIDGLPEGYTVYEYVVTIPPSEDMRSYGGQGYNAATNTWTVPPTKFYNDPVAGTNPKAGILMTGQLIFNSSGELVNQTAYTYGGQDTPAANNQQSLLPDNKAAWQPTKISTNGLPVFTANFTGQPLANSVTETMSTGGTAFSQAQDYIIELDLGLRNTGSPAWKNPTQNLAGLVVQNDPGPPPRNFINYNTNVPTMGVADRQEGAITNRAGTSTEIKNAQDGYASGILSDTMIDNSGVVYGIYSNSVSLPLYQISLYDFMCEQGLRREGGNLFSATRESGDPRVGVAGDSGFGATRAYNIEMSNVDMSTQFVQMITTQRGFQANSKGITTVDTMLETVIGMKR